MKYALTHQHPSKRAFVTGAASGLGKAYCIELAQDGWTLGIADINAEGLATVAKEFEELGAKVITYRLDVSDRNQFQKVSEQFLLDAGGIDLLFNNAGVGDGGTFEEYSLDNWEWMTRINQLSVVYGCHFFIPAFKKQKSGHILNTASFAAITCAPTMGAYNMTKAAVVAISETLYCELMDYNIRVSSVQPAYFKTNIAQSVRGGDLVKKTTQFFLDRSRLEAKEVAQEILTRAGKGELYIILPKGARKMWKLKRLAPTWFRKTVKEKYAAAARKVR
ncbi:MAG TPA: SDR family NAD(P)-dependent oxidoreductase [Cyclobacteriaceae bacterium]|nr:SDR family NAD(P)-dependent oxidoreductase [Cyclobacteriaceae bacterium]